MNRLVKFSLPVVVLGLGISTYQYLLDTKAAPESLNQNRQPVVVAAQSVRHEDLAPELTLFGRIEAPYNSVLSASIATDVVKVSVQEGDTVQQGDILIQLDDTDAALNVRQKIASVAEIEAQANSDRRTFMADQEALEREQAMLGLVRKGVARARKLANTNAGTQATLDEALQQEEQLLLAISQRKRSIDNYEIRQDLWKARLNNAKAALRLAEYALSRTVVPAPYRGRVIEVHVSPGDRATPGTPLVRMFDHLNLEVRAQIPGRYVPRLKETLDQGEEIRATLHNDQALVHLTLDRLAAAVVQGQGGIDVFFHTEPGALPDLGSTVELTLKLSPLEGVVAIPQDALYRDNRLYRIVDNHLESLVVRRLGHRRDHTGELQLLVDGSTLQEGDLIMISRLSNAIDGLAVQPDVMNE